MSHTEKLDTGSESFVPQVGDRVIAIPEGREREVERGQVVAIDSSPRAVLTHWVHLDNDERHWSKSAELSEEYVD